MDKYTMGYNMKDYEWTVFREKILIDKGLNTDNLGWKNGDHFEFTNIDGRQMLVKVESSKTLKGNDHGRNSKTSIT
jgi:hypothetical protein